nr:DUF4297 family anti-phage-associated protein [Rhodoferax sp.]
MTNRSANATIKGYFYQFDHTILKILGASSGSASVVIEGIEDIDFTDGSDDVLVQCKYYEGTEYNHSVIKDAVIQMLRHYHKAGQFEKQQLRYRVFGHYKSGQDKLKQPFNLNFLKENFLTYTESDKDKKKTKQLEHERLKLSDAQLAHFQNLLEINIDAPSYENQQSQIVTTLKTQIAICSQEDAEVFYYPNAINAIQRLAVKQDIKDRKITKADFLARINCKEIVFNRWLHQKFGDEYYAKSIKRKHFKFASTKVPCASRIFVIDTAGEFEISKVTTLLSNLGNRFSHVEHKSTPQKDRFCPYVILRDLPIQDLIALKKNLLQQGINFVDGYPFQGSDFDPKLVASAPTKDNLIKLKFIPSLEQIKPMGKELKGSFIEVFDFFKSSPLEVNHIPTGVSCHSIKVPSLYLINEVF